jgi:hypothetical protein
MPSIEVITNICGDKDYIIDDQVKGGATFTCFTDGELQSSTWNIKKAYDKFKDPRRNSRITKLMPHKYSDADIIITIDGNMRLLATPEEIVEKYLGDYDMAVFKHGMRDCVYDEAIECAKLGLDDIELIIEQAKHYENQDFAKHKGLVQGCFIVRRNNRKVAMFNEFWWADYCRFSRRDQLSLMPAIEKSGIRVNIINDGWILNPTATLGGVVEMRHHKHFEGNFNEVK